jgi:hypothetical protein
MADLTPVISETLHNVSTDPNNTMTPSDATAITPVVAAKVNEEVKQIVINETNNEPWYQSRVILGIGTALVVQVLTRVGVQADLIDPQGVTDLVAQALSFVAGGYALYGRITTQKPIGK